MSTFDEVVGWITGSDDDVPVEALAKAMDSRGMPVAAPTIEKPRAMFHDPYAVMDWGGWRQRPSALTYETLRQSAAANTVIAAIINLRTHQVSEFCRPQQGRYDKGYRVVLRDRRDKKKGMSKAEQKEAEAIERFLETTAVLLPDEKPSDRDSFRAFVKKAVHDVLTYDQWCWEKIRDRKGRPSRFAALPSETIRPAVADVEHMDPAQLRSRVSHVQVYENTVIAEFATDDIAWCIMNPRADLRANNFGYSPIEKIIRLVTAWLFGFEYNTKFFTQGSAIKGLLNIKGAIPDRQLRAFRRMWYSMIAGVQNAWKTPILNAEDIQWHSMHSTNREMEYGQWMDWLTKLICAIYGVDPIEINFIFGNSGQSSSMNQSRPNAEEVTESKDKGLRPLLTHIEDHLNAHMIWDLNPDFEFVFAGYDAKAEEKERQGWIELAKSTHFVDEVRAMMDEEPLPDGLGEVILDPTWKDFAMQKQGMAEQAGDMGEGGEGNTFDNLFGAEDGGGEEGGEEGGDDGPPGSPKPPGGGGALASQSGGESANKAPLERSHVTTPSERLEKSKDGRLAFIDIWLPRE